MSRPHYPQGDALVDKIYDIAISNLEKHNRILDLVYVAPADLAEIIKSLGASDVVDFQNLRIITPTGEVGIHSTSSMPVNSVYAVTRSTP